MRQKYVISQEGAQHDFKIREYAIIDKNLRRVETDMLREEDFEFLCEETWQMSGRRSVFISKLLDLKYWKSTLQFWRLSSLKLQLKSYDEVPG